MLALIASLERIPAHAAKSSATPRFFRRSLVPPDMDIAAATMRLYAYLPKRDWVVVRWGGWRVAGLDEADPSGRLAIAAEVNGVMLAYITNPRNVRRFANRKRSVVDEWMVQRDE